MVTLNTVSFDFAKKLKNAGFPQPKSGDSQFWFDESGVFLLLIREIDGILYPCDPNTGQIDRMFDIGEVTEYEAFFAPTAQQIIDDLPILGKEGQLVAVHNPFLTGGHVYLNADEYAQRWLELKGEG